MEQFSIDLDRLGAEVINNLHNDTANVFACDDIYHQVR